MNRFHNKSALRLEALEDRRVLSTLGLGGVDANTHVALIRPSDDGIVIDPAYNKYLKGGLDNTSVDSSLKVEFSIRPSDALGGEEAVDGDVESSTGKVLNPLGGAAAVDATLSKDKIMAQHALGGAEAVDGSMSKEKIMAKGSLGGAEAADASMSKEKIYAKGSLGGESAGPAQLESERILLVDTVFAESVKGEFAKETISTKPSQGVNHDRPPVESEVYVGFCHMMRPLASDTPVGESISHF